MASCEGKMKGFTLIEILVSSTIFLLLVAVGFQSMSSGREAWYTSSATVAARQEIMKAYLQMEKELKETRPTQINLTIGNNASSISFKLPCDINGDGTILDATGNIEWCANSTVYSLNATSQQITRTLSGTTTVLANNITSLQFFRPASTPTMLQINMTTQKRTPSSRTIQDAEQFTIKMRN